MIAFRVLAPLVIVGTVLHPGGPAGRLLESRPFRVVGRLSYSIYLWQQLFMVPNGSRLPALGFLQTLPWNLLGSAACATASHWLVEQPLIRLGHRLTSKKPTPSTPRPAATMPEALPADPLSPVR